MQGACPKPPKFNVHGVSAMLVQVRGKTLSVETQGTGEPVVLLHGLGSTANVWEPQVRALADRFTLVRYDLEGMGRSPFAGTLSVESWVEDLKALLDFHRIGKARLVGHSLGTLILQHFAVAYPQHVDKLVFIGVNRAPPEARRVAIRERVAKVRAEGIDAIVDTVVKGGVSPHTLAEKPEIVAFVRELLTRQPVEGYARSCEAMAAAVAADVSAIKAPVLVIAGRDDAVSPIANGEGLTADIAGAQLRIVEQCGHWHPIEQPAAITAALREFL
jgi:3-oxoadipate enol-lactonase